MKRKLLSLLLALSLLLSLTAPALAAETASVIRLTKTTGTVEISKSSGKSISLLQNMRLYNGYHVSTDEESYAWINLDDSKLLKEDAESEVEVRKDGRNLEVLTVSGNVFFDVAKDLEDDESLNIRTSTMAVGIRGTSGWLHVVDRWVTRVSVLEGVVECSVADPVTGELKSEEIHGGETALCVVYPQEKTGDKSAILRDKFTVDDIPGFVLTELVRNMALCDKIEAATGLDIPRDLAAVAGGDPSGRTPEGDSATREVLGEADRREDEDEDGLHEKLEEIEKELEKQPEAVSPSKPIEKPAAPAPSGKDSGGDSGGSSGGSTTPAPAPTPPATRGMKLTDVEVQTLLADTNNLSVEPNTDAADATPKKNTLEVDTGLTVASGKTLDLQSGVDLEVYPGKQLQVDGTLTADALTNNGTTTVTSGNTLRLRGNLTTSGTLNVTSTGRIVVDGTFTRTGALTLADGAAVLAKTFAPDAAPEGWEVSATADADGYYRLTPEGGDTPVDPETHSITFNANGGKWGTDTESTIAHTDETGKVVSWPEAPVYGVTPATSNDGPGLTFAGWYTADGVKKEPTDTFTADTALIAHWNGWLVDSEGTLVVGVKEAADDYTIKTAITSEPGARVSYSDAPWGTKMSSYDAPPDANIVKAIVVKEGVTSIGSYAFWGVQVEHTAFSGTSEVTSVTIPDSVTTIGQGAFGYNVKLTSIDIPASVTSIGDEAFYRCSGLTSLTIPASVTSIGDDAFFGCTGLTRVTFASGSKLASIGNGAFSSCTGLTKVTIPAGVKTIGREAFNYCTGLTEVTIPASVQTIESYAFFYCKNMTSLTISSGVPSIGEAAFHSCLGLTKVTIPGTVKTIGDYAFYNCPGLRNVTMEAGVESIGAGAFAIPPDYGDGRPNLTWIAIPATVTSIGESVFEDCYTLRDIYFGGTEARWQTLLSNSPNAGIPTVTVTMHYSSGGPTP